MKPPVAKTRHAPEMRARVLELRRTHSNAEVARQTGLPIGTVKALASRAGVTRNNTQARTFFALPEPVLGAGAAVALPAPLPEQRSVTGDAELDAVLWLREVVQTGDAELIGKAMQGAERIKTPPQELERRYADHLVRTSGGNAMQGLFAFGIADLQGYAKKVLDRQARRSDALNRFGNEAAVFADTDTERFCIAALASVKARKAWPSYALKAVCIAFDMQADMRPHSLDDCLFELAYWNGLYQLRRAWPDAGDPLPQVSAREDYLHDCMGHLPPKSKAEAKDVLRYLTGPGRDAVSEEATDRILQNLVG